MRTRSGMTEHCAFALAPCSVTRRLIQAVLCHCAGVVVQRTNCGRPPRRTTPFRTTPSRGRTMPRRAKPYEFPPVRPDVHVCSGDFVSKELHRGKHGEDGTKTTRAVWCNCCPVKSVRPPNIAGHFPGHASTCQNPPGLQFPASGTLARLVAPFRFSRTTVLLLGRLCFVESRVRACGCSMEMDSTCGYVSSQGCCCPRMTAATPALIVSSSRRCHERAVSSGVAPLSAGGGRQTA